MDFDIAGGYDSLSITLLWAGVKVTSGVRSVVTAVEDPGELSVDVAFKRRGAVLCAVEVGHASSLATGTPLSRAHVGTVESETGLIQVVDGYGIVACAFETRPGTVNYEIWLGSEDDAYTRVVIVVVEAPRVTAHAQDARTASRSVFGYGETISVHRDVVGLLATTARWPLELVVQTGLRRDVESRSQHLGTVVLDPEPTSEITFEFRQSARLKSAGKLTEVGRVEVGGHFPVLTIRGPSGEVLHQASLGYGRMDAIVVFGDRAEQAQNFGVLLMPIA